MPIWTPTFVTTDDGWVNRNTTTTPETLYYSSSNSFARLGSRVISATEVDGQSYIWLQNVPIPKGATVSSAPFIQKYFSKQVSGTTNPGFIVEVEPAANAQRPTTASDFYGRSRSMSTNLGKLIGATGTPAATAPITFEVGPLIQSIVNRSDWVSGNDILIFLKADALNPAGENYQVSFYSLNSTGNEPTLTVTWNNTVTGAGTATANPSTVSGTANANRLKYQGALSRTNPASTVSATGAMDPAPAPAVVGTLEITNPASYMRIAMLNPPAIGYGEAEFESTSYKGAYSGTNPPAGVTGAAATANAVQIGRAEHTNPASTVAATATVADHPLTGTLQVTNPPATVQGVANIIVRSVEGFGEGTNAPAAVSATAVAGTVAVQGEGLVTNPGQSGGGTAEYVRGVPLQNFSVYRRGPWLVVEIRANKELMVASGTSYFWNYYGQPIGLSLHRLSSGIRYPLALVEDTAVSPAIAADVFRGYYPAKDIPDGLYQIEGYIKAQSEKVTVISAAQGVTPDNLQTITFTLLGGRAIDWSDIGLVEFPLLRDLRDLSPVYDLTTYPKVFDLVTYPTVYGIEEV